MDTVFRNENDPNGVVLTMFFLPSKGTGVEGSNDLLLSRVVRPLDYLHFQPRLQNHLIDFD